MIRNDLKDWCAEENIFYTYQLGKGQVSAPIFQRTQNKQSSFNPSD
jgi:hypothetical protein